MNHLSFVPGTSPLCHACLTSHENHCDLQADGWEKAEKPQSVHSFKEAGGLDRCLQGKNISQVPRSVRLSPTPTSSAPLRIPHPLGNPLICPETWELGWTNLPAVTTLTLLHHVQDTASCSHYRTGSWHAVEGARLCASHAARAGPAATLRLWHKNYRTRTDHITQ